MGIELYSEVEELFLDKEAAHILWSKFIEILKDYNINNVLDIGCGSGDFCLMAREEGIKIKGIDISKFQVQKAKSRGCDCDVIDICEIEENFDSAVAIFDVVNYLSPKKIGEFFKCVKKRIDRYFIFDINTKFAMEDLAIGTLKAESEDKFSVLYSEFENNILKTEITLFNKVGECYKKRQKEIVQYYYSIEDIIKISKMELVKTIPISLYGSEEAEKYILILKID